jgi:cytoskeletal protein CcmA (bactofilin family)
MGVPMEGKMNIMKTKNGQRPRLVGASKQPLEVSVIGEDMEVVGSVHSSGVVKVSGIVLGNVSADDKLLVAKGGRVKGDVCAREVVLNGEVCGSVVAEKRVELQGSAVIHGDITTPHLIRSEAESFGKPAETAIWWSIRWPVFKTHGEKPFMTTPTRPHRLSKSRFAAGCQCHKLLWWRVHEPQAEELQPDIVLQDRLDQGRQVGEMARDRFPGGVLIDFPHREVDAKIAATKAALDGGAPAIFEASFLADDVFVAVDVLERNGDGFTLIEVKSSSSQKPEHVPDAAIQTHVLRQCEITVHCAEIMHLNREFRFPDQGDLFRRTDVTTPVEQMLGEVPDEIARQLDAIGGPLPEVAIGAHCFEPRDCPFMNRCWPDSPRHIGKLYSATDDAEALRTRIPPTRMVGGGA